MHTPPTTRRFDWPALALYIAVTCVMLYPLSLVWRPHLPDLDDAMFNVWRLAWVAHALRAGDASLFDGNIFHPAGNTLALSDAMLLLGLLGAPLQWAGLHPVTTQNVLLVGAFISAAYGAFVLALAVTGSRAGAVVAGIIFGFAPYRFAHIAHLELLWTALLPLATLALLRLLEAPSLKRGMTLGVIVGLQGLTGIYYVVYLTIFLALLFALTAALRPALDRRHVGSMVLAVATALLMLAPYASQYLEARRDVPGRKIEEIQRYSGEAGDYLRTASPNRVYGGVRREAEEERSLFPGVTTIALALAGLFTLRSPRDRRAVIIFSTLTGVSVDLSLGLNGWIYPLLLDLVPLLDGFRAPARFSVFVLMCLAVLAAFGVRACQSLGVKTAGVVATAVLLCLVEYWHAPLVVRTVPVEPPPVYTWLARQPSGVVLELPVPEPDALWHWEARHQFMSIYHWRPLVNGYSGSAPASYLQAIAALREFPLGDTEAILRRLNARYVVLHERMLGDTRYGELLSETSGRHPFGEAIVLADTQGRAAVLPVLERPQRDEEPPR